MISKKRVYTIIEKAQDGDKASLVFDYFLLTLIIINVLAVILDFNESISTEYHILLRIIEYVSITIFIFEYLLRLWTANYKYPNSKIPYLKFIFSPLGIADLLAFLPFFLPFLLAVDLRFLRIFRFFRILVKVIRTLVVSNREKKFIHQALSTYLSSSVVNELLANPSKLNLGGEKREITAFFSDLKDFSKISEKVDPTHLVKILNKYLTSMSNIIMDNKGTIDKFIGDSIVAFFGAPIFNEDHAKFACISALSMKKAEDEINSMMLAEDLSPIPLFTRIGINTGEMVVGNMGSETKMNYTIMGNAVNLAARLEGVNKYYKTGIIISEFTKNKTGDYFLCRQLDRIRVVGIDKPILIYELTGNKEQADEVELNYHKKWNEAITYFEQRDFLQAGNLFSNLVKEYPSGYENDYITTIYKKRCISYQKKPPPPDWDGILDIYEK